MKYSKFFSIVVMLVIGIYGAVGWYFLPLAGFDGNLPRMAKLPENLFGWNKPQPKIDPTLLHQARWDEADMLVIGDSFSDTRVWQTVLVKRGIRIRTQHWTQIRGICEDFPSWLKAQGFRGKWIVFESVEVSTEAGVRYEANCKHVVYHPSVEAEKTRRPPRTNRLAEDRSGRLSVGIETWLNARRYEQAAAARDFKFMQFPSVDLQRLPQGCDWFSHARCNDVLFLSWDNKPDLTDGVLDAAETINARLPGITPIWVFVPNKSTTYRYPDKTFWDRAETRLHSPNLLRRFRQALQDKMQDLYPANESHLSTAGYLLMGEEILATMQRAQATGATR